MSRQNAVIKIQQTAGGAFKGTCDEWAGVYAVQPTPGEAYDEAYRQLLLYRYQTRRIEA